MQSDSRAYTSKRHVIFDRFFSKMANFLKFLLKGVNLNYAFMQRVLSPRKKKERN